MAILSYLALKSNFRANAKKKICFFLSCAHLAQQPAAKGHDE
jgi:hypothetical protein